MKIAVFLALIVGQAAAAAVPSPAPTQEAGKLDVLLAEFNASAAEKGQSINVSQKDLGIPDTEKPQKMPLPFAQLGWVGVLTPGGPKVEYWGDNLDDIEAQVKKEHPGSSIYSDTDVPWNPEDVDIEQSDNPPHAARKELQARNPGYGERNCNYWGWANPNKLWDASRNLRRVTGACVAPARSCTRMQCVFDTAVAVCNDNRHNLYLPCSYVADGADRLNRECYSFDGVLCSLANPFQKCVRVNERVHGQIFSPGRTWNVLAGTCGRIGHYWDLQWR